MAHCDFGLETAREWYYGDDEVLRNLAIEKYGEYDLMNEEDQLDLEMEVLWESCKRSMDRYEADRDYEAACAAYD